MCQTVIFYDSTFPIDGPRPDHTFFDDLQDNVKLVTANELADSLANEQVQSFIHLHGSYFPKDAWPAIYQYLQSGKGFVHVGGSPLRIPVFLANGKWQVEREQTAYHQLLNIHEVLAVQANPIHTLKHNQDIPLFADSEDLFSVEHTYNFVLHTTKNASIPNEMGSVGSMDVIIQPLLKGISKSKREVAAPIVLLENMKGKFLGGRWVFINQQMNENFWTTRGKTLLEEIAHFVSLGVTEMSLKTDVATYDLGDRPKITYQIQQLSGKQVEWELDFTLAKDDEPCHSITKTVTASDIQQSTSFSIPIDVTPGLYKLVCRARAKSGEERILHQGFWGMDESLLQSGRPMAADRDYFQKDGRPLPIVGMTYMTSDVARYFLFLPNPSVWDRDMAQMKKAGINYIRTGVWTAWRNMMFVDGHVDEGVLKAIDAFILCAKKHDLEVTFTFFSFTPEMWEGVNPYLDPRSIEAQKRFITAIVSRHTKTTNINWDLINEPSLFDPNRTFGGPRPLGDSYDRQSYQAWLQKRHPSIRELQERWNMTEEELPSFSAITPPDPSEINFGVRDMMSGKKGLKWIDYTLYTMDMHNQWARELSKPIKELAEKQLITVGQDEGLAGLRPSPLFYNEVVDYTTNHTWWLLDELVWDGIFTKTPNKPNLIQETGIMYVENPNNQARRSEEELRNILERKYAYSFSTGGAGAVQWVWNTNYFMNNINESNIGALRADGTEKPEADVSYDFGAFIQETRDVFTDRELEEIAVVFPFSNDFSNRRMSMDATTKLTRVLAHEMNVPFRSISEYDLEPLQDELPKLIIVPSAHHFNSEALEKLLQIVHEQEVTLLFTGPMNLDEYWHNTNRMKQIAGNTTIENIVREEILTINDRHYPVSFGKERIADAKKETRLDTESPSAIQEITYGKGKLIWSPLPVELNERSEPLIALYSYAMEEAQVATHLEWLEGDVPGVYGRKLTFGKGNLFIFVSEYGLDTQVKIKDPISLKTYTFELEKERTVMFMTNKQGEVTARYRPDEVIINIT